jgi:hypothetical protein
MFNYEGPIKGKKVQVNTRTYDIYGCWYCRKAKKQNNESMEHTNSNDNLTITRNN